LYFQFEDNIATKKTIVELTAHNFADTTSNNFAFVVFFAPWCKYCKLLLPIFQELAKQMAATEQLVFATVDSKIWLISLFFNRLFFEFRWTVQLKIIFVQNMASKVIRL